MIEYHRPEFGFEPECDRARYPVLGVNDFERVVGSCEIQGLIREGFDIFARLFPVLVTNTTNFESVDPASWTKPLKKWLRRIIELGNIGKIEASAHQIST